jgi:hypothetical protein
MRLFACKFNVHAPQSRLMSSVKFRNCVHVMLRGHFSLPALHSSRQANTQFPARAAHCFIIEMIVRKQTRNIDTRQCNLFLLRKSTVALAFKLCLRLLQPERRDRYLRRISNLRRPVEFFQTSCSCKNIGVGRWQVGPKELCEAERLRARSTVLPQGHAKSLGQRPA